MEKNLKSTYSIMEYVTTSGEVILQAVNEKGEVHSIKVKPHVKNIAYNSNSKETRCELLGIYNATEEEVLYHLNILESYILLENKIVDNLLKATQLEDISCNIKVSPTFNTKSLKEFMTVQINVEADGYDGIEYGFESEEELKNIENDIVNDILEEI